ncbi:MAG: glutamate synthase subunit beta [Zoogloeaceae bacterium]|jgi:glutamate synthase (NADPH/NADH) small chain|nr:glutamate synthase subunit beta [Zoogloeaceae bacterium]
MGKPTGFLEYPRQTQEYLPVDERVRNYREFILRLPDEKARIQGARCMDCGVPFCNNACPVNNIIPDWNDLVHRGKWQQAATVLHSTNNFPEFTSRVCPSPCEAACTLGYNADSVGIKSVEQAIVEKAWEEGWVQPKPASVRTGRKVAVVGSGPAGLAAAQQLARAGHAVTVFEKNDRVGGLLRYGIPDFKLDKGVIDRRVAQLQAEGVQFRTGVLVGVDALPEGIASDAKETLAASVVLAAFDAVVLAGGAEVPRDLPVPGRQLEGVHFALEFLIPQNRQVAGDGTGLISAAGCNVVVIGGGDTGADCVGTSHRHGAKSVTQLELMPRPPEKEDKTLTWPYWPNRLRVSSSHQEGETRCEYAIATKEFIGEDGSLTGVKTVRLEWNEGRMTEIPGSEEILPAERVFLAMGFTNPVSGMLEAFGVEKDARGNAKASVETEGGYATNVPGVFAAGDIRRGQSLVVWAIREGRQCARAVDEFLMGASLLPR